jgi:uncharacterized protein YcbK (DUF882 family)
MAIINKHEVVLLFIVKVRLVSNEATAVSLRLPRTVSQTNREKGKSKEMQMVSCNRNPFIESTRSDRRVATKIN